MTTFDQINELRTRMSQSIIGQDAVVDRLVLGLLADGNILLEGLPGLAKTRAIKSMATHLVADFSRIQFTPDLLPADITGSEVYFSDGGRGEFKFQAGPIFANLVLADEINRAPAKVQAALLEAMEERQVTVSGTTHEVPDLFMVLATQNPIEQEGTYPLPEAQMDRFQMHVIITYPDEESEVKVLQLVRREDAESMQQHDVHSSNDSATQIPQQAVFDARREISQIAVSDGMEKYIVDLISATRFPEKYDQELASWIEVGASPRGGIAIDRVARAHAWMKHREMITPDDIRAIIHDCLRHRISLSYEAKAEGVGADQVLDKILELVAVA